MRSQLESAMKAGVHFLKDSRAHPQCLGIPCHLCECALNSQAPSSNVPLILILYELLIECEMRWNTNVRTCESQVFSRRWLSERQISSKRWEETISYFVQGGFHWGGGGWFPLCFEMTRGCGGGLAWRCKQYSTSSTSPSVRPGVSLPYCLHVCGAKRFECARPQWESTGPRRVENRVLVELL